MKNLRGISLLRFLFTTSFQFLCDPRKFSLCRAPGFWPFHSASFRRIGVQCNKISIRRSECPPLFKFRDNWHSILIYFDVYRKNVRRYSLNLSLRRLQPLSKGVALKFILAISAEKVILLPYHNKHISYSAGVGRTGMFIVVDAVLKFVSSWQENQNPAKAPCELNITGMK